jgi:hypothetical protein
MSAYFPTEAWGQPEIGLLHFASATEHGSENDVPVGMVLFPGAISSSRDPSAPIDRVLAAELAAWDELSNEALDGVDSDPDTTD